MRKHILVYLCALIGIFSSHKNYATSDIPSISQASQHYAFVEVDLKSIGSYKDLVKVKKHVEIIIPWNYWAGSGGDSYKVYFDNIIVNKGNLPINTNSGVIRFPYDQAGRYKMTFALCKGNLCKKSLPKEIIIADTDGAHLAPLSTQEKITDLLNVDDIDQIKAASYLEPEIYNYHDTLTEISSKNFTHLLYGLVPICNPRSNGGQALKIACSNSSDFEIVIHDPWAALQKRLPEIELTEPIQGTYAQLMILKQRHPKLKILPSLDGWTLSCLLLDFAQKNNRTIFINSLRSFLITWKFYGGINIDWTHPNNDRDLITLQNTTKNNKTYIILMEELRNMLKDLTAKTGRPYELTSAITSDHNKAVSYAAATKQAEHIFTSTTHFTHNSKKNRPHHKTLHEKETLKMIEFQSLRNNSIEMGYDEVSNIPYLWNKYTKQSVYY